MFTLRWYIMITNLCELKKEDYENKKSEIIKKNFEEKYLDSKILFSHHYDNIKWIYTRKLDNLGFTDVYGVSNIDQAFDYIKKNDVDLIFTNGFIFDSNGKTLIEKIRVDENLKNIPVIAATSDAMKGDREQYLNKGYNDYMIIPEIDLDINTITRKNLEFQLSRKIEYKFNEIVLIKNESSISKIENKLYNYDFINTTICTDYNEAINYLKNKEVKLIITQLDSFFRLKNNDIEKFKFLSENNNVIAVHSSGSASDISEHMSYENLHKNPLCSIKKLLDKYMKQ